MVRPGGSARIIHPGEIRFIKGTLMFRKRFRDLVRGWGDGEFVTIFEMRMGKVVSEIFLII